MVIHTHDQRLRVFVSSTLGELAPERRAVARAIATLRLTPVMFEDGARPHPPQDLYRAYLAQSDVFIGLYWQRYGWVGAGMQISGLEDEFELARALPRLLYLKTPAPDREPLLAEMLNRVEAEGLVSYRSFSTPAELGRLVRDDLATLLSERFAERPAVSAMVPVRSRPLPVGTTSLIGRDQTIKLVAELLNRSGARLVTMTGPGGIGKTRLAVAVGERVRDHFDAGVVFVPLDRATRSEQVLLGIARAVGANLTGTESALQALAEHLAGDRWLLILDNMEQVLEAAGDLGELLSRCPGVVILATSRTVLGLQGEQESPVPPLLLPVSATEPAEALLASPAVALFVDRARAVRPGFKLTEENAAQVVEICRRLEGLPLAIELAAARTRLLDPAALLQRLTKSLDALGRGARDLPERQRTLRDTARWSMDLLDEDERSLLETTAIFVNGWTVDAAARVAGLAEDRALDLSEALARHSLIQVDSTELGPRMRMLNVVHEFVAERLAVRPDRAQIARRHADYYRAQADLADRPLRGLNQDHWAGLMESEADNLAAAVNWYLANDREPLPHLFRALWLYWGLRDHLSEARAWISELLPTADELPPQAQAELLWTAAVTDVEVVGDDEVARATSRRLESLLSAIQDPYLHAVSQLAVAGISAAVGDFDGALRRESVALDELRHQDEPYWTTVAVLTSGLMETAMGNLDGALGRLREARELAGRFDHAGLSAWSQVQLGILALGQGRPEEAEELLDEGLELSLATHSTRNVTLCLTAFAQLAFVVGDGDRAARLAGATEGLRGRAGLRAWPLQRAGEAQMVAQMRQALGADRFDREFAAGRRLDRREAVAFVRASLPVRP